MILDYNIAEKFTEELDWKKIYIHYKYRSNKYGQLGLGQIGLNRWNREFTELKGYQAKQIACGESNSAFIDLNGNLYTFGSNEDGQLGRDGNNKFPKKVSIDIPIIQVSCGHYHMACIEANHDIWIFGANDYGQLGLGGD